MHRDVELQGCIDVFETLTVEYNILFITVRLQSSLLASLFAKEMCLGINGSFGSMGLCLGQDNVILVPRARLCFYVHGQTMHSF